MAHWRPRRPDAYRKLFSETARLATTVIVTLGHDATAPLIGDFMLRRENAWAQLDVADQARDTQALHREKGGLGAPALLRRHCASLAVAGDGPPRRGNRVSPPGSRLKRRKPN